ncbi:MAG TPA: ATPase, T2SS/T4P/T4SS family [Polyangia bacterium]|nr:ATPase, T2SS/T4P/T4SS family [Polyangia bacterium]
MIKLTLTEKNGEPRLLTFDKDEITIGRVSGNDIVLAKGNVSKKHSRFTVRSPGQIEVADLKSTNGTYVNGRKIGSPMLLSASDRVYVGDFLISIDLGVGAAHSDFGADYPAHSPADLPAGAGGGSAGHRLPIPPPPPPPRGRVGSSAAQLPTYGDSDGDGDPGFGGDDELGLAARPPGSGRVPIPPPPPPRRPPTPLASRGLGESDFDDGLGSAAPAISDEPADDTGSVGLFANSRTADDESSRRPTGARPGAAAVPAVVPSFGSASAAPPMTTDVGGSAAGFEALLGDAAVTQILITAPDAALVDRGSGLSLHDGSLGDPNAVADALWRLANTAFPPPAPDNPVVDVRLADGTRVSAAFPPASPTGVVAAIRRPVLLARTLSDLIPGGSKDAQTLLESAMAARRNLLLTGDAAAMPQVLGALAAAIPADRRVVAIGAAQPQARGGWTDLAPAADMAGLLRVASTLRADHLMVGEVMGPELGELLLVASRGQEGLIAALPGRSTIETLGRLAALAAAGLGATASVTTALCASAFDLVVHVVAVTDGTVRIVEVAEPRVDGATLTADSVLAFSGEGNRREPGAGRLQGRGVSARLSAAFTVAGSPLPSSLVNK